VEKIEVVVTIDGKKMKLIRMVGEWRPTFCCKKSESLYNSGWLLESPKLAKWQYGIYFERKKEGV